MLHNDLVITYQISHLINHPFPDQFQNSLRTKSLRNVQLDLSRLDEHFTNSKTVTKPLRSCIFDETRPRLKIFEDYHRIGEHDNVIAKTLRRRWTLKTSSCADGQPIIFGEIEDINELFGAISCHDGSLVCFKLVSGDEIFQLKLSSRAMTLSVWVGYICATTSNGEFFLICHKSGKIALRHQIESPSGSILPDPCHIRCPATFLASIRTRSKSDSVIQPTQTGRLTSIRKFKVFNGRLELDQKFKLLEIDDSLNTKVSLVPSSEGPSSILICSMKGKIIVADIDTGLVKYKNHLDMIVFNQPVISSNLSANQKRFFIPDVRGFIHILDAQLKPFKTIRLSINPIYCPLTLDEESIWTATEKGEILTLDIESLRVRKWEPDAKMPEKITAKIHVKKSSVMRCILICYVTGMVKIYKADEWTNGNPLLKTVTSFDLAAESWSGCFAFSNYFLIGSRDDRVTCLQLPNDDS